jgi:hypothetical protein
MAKTLNILTVFVASPSDVAAERAILEDVVQELNVTWSSSLGVALEVVGWTTHAHPAMGTDAQDVINRQIPPGYDIFVGIMWTKFGTPTGRAGSGTEEEFDRALARYRDDPSSVKIMFYFKDAPVPPSELDLAQYGNVRSFRERLGKEGGLYWTFTSEFESFVRLHLAREIQDWLRGVSATTGTATAADSKSVTKVAPSSASDDDELGVLDYMEAFGDHFARLMESQTRLTDAINELGARITERTEEQKRANVEHAGDFKVMKRVANRVAEDMTQFVARVDVEYPIFGNEMEATMKSFSMAVTLAGDFGPDALGDTTQLRANVVAMAATLQSTTVSTFEFREVIAVSPRLTTEYNRARRKTVDVLDRLVEQMRTGHALLMQVVDAIDGLQNLPVVNYT